MFLIDLHSFVSDSPLLNTAQVAGDLHPSAGILIYTVDPATNELLFVVAQEEHHVGWSNSGTWSAFEGGRKSCDVDVYDTAAREFIEESLSSIDMGSHEDLANTLRTGAYTLDVSVSIESGSSSLRTTVENGRIMQHVDNARRTIRTFIVYVDWESVTGAPARFARKREALINLKDSFTQSKSRGHDVSDIINAAKKLRQSLPPGAIDLVADDTCLLFPTDFHEKRCVQLWTAKKLYNLSLFRNNQEDSIAVVKDNTQVGEHLKLQTPKMRAAFVPVVLAALVELMGMSKVSDMCTISSGESETKEWRSIKNI